MISLQDAAVREDVVEAAARAGDRVLHGVPDAGIAFSILHVGRQGVWLLLDRWEGDILRHHHFRADLGDPARFADVSAQHCGPCVWELAVQAHERQAWITHVLSNPRSPDLDGYLADGLTAVL